MLFNLPAVKIVKGTLNNIGGQNKIKEGCKDGKLFITLECYRNFKSMYYEWAKLQASSPLNVGTEFKSC